MQGGGLTPKLWEAFVGSEVFNVQGDLRFSRALLGTGPQRERRH